MKSENRGVVRLERDLIVERIRIAAIGSRNVGSSQSTGGSETLPLQLRAVAVAG
jgi:hypothetical protein